MRSGKASILERCVFSRQTALRVETWPLGIPDELLETSVELFGYGIWAASRHSSHICVAQELVDEPH